jgi:hypothetical protein
MGAPRKAPLSTLEPGVALRSKPGYVPVIAPRSILAAEGGIGKWLRSGILCDLV